MSDSANYKKVDQKQTKEKVILKDKQHCYSVINQKANKF